MLRRRLAFVLGVAAVLSAATMSSQADEPVGPRLTPKLRDALLLAQSGEYQYDEIARMLDIPVGTVKWRISEARRKVRERLADLGYVDAR